jgi:hypothetical protein
LHIPKYLEVVVSLVILQALPSIANAQMNTGVERQKVHMVSRMYQATYGAQERCRPSREASVKLDMAIEQFRNALPELMSLVDSSPYLPQAKEQFKVFLSKAPAPQNDQALVEECAGIADMLHQLADTPGGQKAADDMIQTLKK